jgi:hypothetical protein
VVVELHLFKVLLHLLQEMVGLVLIQVEMVQVVLVKQVEQVEQILVVEVEQVLTLTLQLVEMVVLA